MGVLLFMEEDLCHTIPSTCFVVCHRKERVLFTDMMLSVHTIASHMDLKVLDKKWLLHFLITNSLVTTIWLSNLQKTNKMWKMQQKILSTLLLREISTLVMPSSLFRLRKVE